MNRKVSIKDIEEAENKDAINGINGVDYSSLPPLNKCRCGGIPIIDTSMGLIYCPRCGLSFEYRYNRGTVPYYMWQLTSNGGPLPQNGFNWLNAYKASFGKCLLGRSKK